jgi:hypothetical protein
MSKDEFEDDLVDDSWPDEDEDTDREIPPEDD